MPLNSGAFLVFAIDVENHPFVLRPLAELLGGQEGDVGDDADFIGNAGIEEVDEDVLVVFGGEDPRRFDFLLSLPRFY